MNILKVVVKSLFIFTLTSNVLAAEEQAPTLQFNWPANGCVPVVEDVIKKGNKAEVQYNMCWKASDEDPGLLIFTYQKYQIKTLNGKPVPAEPLKNLTKTMANIPAFYVRKADGEFVGLEPKALDKCFDLIAEIAADSQKANLKQVKETIKNNPEILAMFEEAVSNPWRSMVSYWQDMDEFGEFISEDDQLVISYFPAEKDQYELQVYNLSDDAFKDYIKKLANSLSKEDVTIPDNTNIEGKVSVISDRNLRPHKANLYKRASFVENGKKVTMEEIHNYTFDWGKFTTKT